MKPILIVEDNDRNLKLLRDVLQVKGYATIEARSAGDGVRLAGEQSPGLVLMDIQLPDFDGIEALALLRADPATRHIAVVAVSASALPDDRERIMASGFDGYITKPISLQELFAIVATFMSALQDTP